MMNKITNNTPIKTNIIQECPESPSKDSPGKESTRSFDKGFKLSFENLLKVDEKIQNIVDCIAADKVEGLNQLASDWWSLTELKSYSILKF
jgi:hypothetical protein